MSVAVVASAATAFGAAATAPPEVPPSSTAAPDETATTEPPLVIEESWALSPAGSLEADAAGQRPDLTYEADQGAVIEDSVTLFNFGNVQLTFRVYSTDAFNNAEGQFDLLPGDQEPVDVGSWVTFPQDLVTVPPGQQVTMPITIKIPVDAAAGDHTGAILASSESIGTGPEGAAVTLDRRTGTRLYLRVNGPLLPELTVADVETSYTHALNSLSGSAEVTYRIENTGNIRLSGAVTVAIAGPFGLGERSVKLPEVPELLPGEDVSFVAEIDGVPALMADFTTVHVVPADFDGSTDVAASTGKDLTFAPPLTFLLVLLFILFGVRARRAYLRHRAAAVAPSPVADPMSQTATDFESQPEPQLT